MSEPHQNPKTNCDNAEFSSCVRKSYEESLQLGRPTDRYAGLVMAMVEQTFTRANFPKPYTETKEDFRGRMAEVFCLNWSKPDQKKVVGYWRVTISRQLCKFRAQHYNYIKYIGRYKTRLVDELLEDIP